MEAHLGLRGFQRWLGFERHRGLALPAKCTRAGAGSRPGDDRWISADNRRHKENGQTDAGQEVYTPGPQHGTSTPLQSDR